MLSTNPDVFSTYFERISHLMAQLGLQADNRFGPYAFTFCLAGHAQIVVRCIPPTGDVNRPDAVVFCERYRDFPMVQTRRVDTDADYRHDTFTDIELNIQCVVNSHTMGSDSYWFVPGSEAGYLAAEAQLLRYVRSVSYSTGDGNRLLPSLIPRTTIRGPTAERGQAYSEWMFDFLYDDKMTPGLPANLSLRYTAEKAKPEDIANDEIRNTANTLLRVRLSHELI